MNTRAQSNDYAYVHCLKYSSEQVVSDGVNIYSGHTDVYFFPRVFTRKPSGGTVTAE
jgi:hypothetical protein